MGYFNEKIVGLMKSGKYGEDIAYKVTAIIDEYAMEHFRINHPDEYWMLIRKIHEATEGCHYDKEFGMWEVEQMYHTDVAGKRVQGEHWSIGQVTPIFEQYKAKLPKTTVYDFYVALNAHFNDKIVEWTKWFAEDAEKKIIEDAVHTYFFDEDVKGDGKIWRYMNAMRK